MKMTVNLNLMTSLQPTISCDSREAVFLKETKFGETTEQVTVQFTPILANN